jgi:hypothetical protein
MVLIGVLAALFLDGIREDFESAKSVSAARLRLVSEVEQNQAELREMVEVVSDRLGRLRELRSNRSSDANLARLAPDFGGFRTAELSDGAWDRLSRSSLGDLVDQDFLRAAFNLYEWNEQLEVLNAEIRDLVFSELYFSPAKVGVALDISERIMEQQLTWAEQLGARYDEFLDACGSA